ncbi:MAG: hypothetical protein JF612_01570 [Planctomycetia bacterium]|jgi:hypothetical protein|nr:hypothetical protein [Planctomycetia bacterium]
MPTSAARRWPRWLPILGWSILGALGVTLLVFLATVTFGAVHGTEFCPQTFERRSYSYYELPLVHLQMTGERHEDLTGDTEKHVTSNKYITQAGSGKKDWHVLIGSRGTRLRRPGDAGILLQYLDAEESNNVYRWVRWSEQNNNLAKVLWPAVQRVALHDMYIFVPDLFELAKSMDDPMQLQQQLDQFVAGKLLILGRRMIERKDPAAVKVLDEAITLDPANSELKEARDSATAHKPEAQATGTAARRGSPAPVNP